MTGCRKILRVSWKQKKTVRCIIVGATSSKRIRRGRLRRWDHNTEDWTELTVNTAAERAGY